MSTAIQIIQIIVSILLVLILLIQLRGGGMGSLFGASQSSTFRTRRGFEKTLFQITIALAVIFLALAVTTMLIS